MTAQLQSVTKCRLCDTSESSIFIESYLDNETKYDLYMCETCRAQWWEPLKNPGAEWYEKDTNYADRNIDPILKPNEKHRDTISFFESRTGRVLDVGCGVGNFLALAKKRGWECWGIDFDRDSVVTARNTFGLENIEASDLTTFIKNHPNERFDLITFFDVFEHIDNHVEFISQVKSLLNPGGHIALSMPYRHGLRWLLPHDLPPRHLTRWDLGSINTFFEGKGFEVQKTWKLSASWHFLVMKIRWNYGSFATLGLVKKAKQNAFNKSSDVNSILPQKRLHIRLLFALAKTKDFLLFGLPALVLWCLLRFTDKRHTDFYLVAKLK